MNLSNNRVFKSFLCANESLIELNLSKKQYGKAVRENLEKNVTFQRLELSGNEIRCQSTIEIAKGLTRNHLLTPLNVSWNGFAKKGMKAISKSLLLNTHLDEIDLSYNRISNIAAKCLGKSMKTNSILRVLKLSWNPINTVLYGSYENTDWCMPTLHFESIYINNGTKTIKDKVLTGISGIKVIIGGFKKKKINSDDKEKLRKELLNILKS